MDNTREKLIELLNCGRMQHTVCSSRGHPVRSFESRLVDEGAVELLADYLIANGVTVQEWIPVTERLPDNDTYILVTTDGVTASAYWHNDRFYAFTAIGVATVGCVTHWMPLPEPPKG